MIGFVLVAAAILIPADAIERGTSSVAGNMFSQAYDQCFSGAGDINWKEAAAAGLLGAANLRPFQPTSTVGNVVNEAFGQGIEGEIAGQF